MKEILRLKTVKFWEMIRKTAQSISIYSTVHKLYILGIYGCMVRGVTDKIKISKRSKYHARH